MEGEITVISFTPFQMPLFYYKTAERSMPIPGSVLRMPLFSEIADFFVNSLFCLYFGESGRPYRSLDKNRQQW